MHPSPISVLSPVTLAFQPFFPSPNTIFLALHCEFRRVCTAFASRKLLQCRRLLHQKLSWSTPSRIGLRARHVPKRSLQMLWGWGWWPEAREASIWPSGITCIAFRLVPSRFPRPRWYKGLLLWRFGSRVFGFFLVWSVWVLRKQRKWKLKSYKALLVMFSVDCLLFERGKCVFCVSQWKMWNCKLWVCLWCFCFCFWDEWRTGNGWESSLLLV